MVLLSGCVLLSNCATIVGGKSYYARVTVKDHPEARINYKAIDMGKGYASFKAPRKEANSFAVTIKEENCEEQKFIYSKRTFRGWALVGTIVTFTGYISTVPIPYGVIVDCATGALWKPDINEKGIVKVDYKHYNYTIDYTGCKQTPIAIDTVLQQTKQIVAKSKLERLTELTEMQTKGLLTEEEYDTEKRKILDSD